jgi:hypothetical protein
MTMDNSFSYSSRLEANLNQTVEEILKEISNEYKIYGFSNDFKIKLVNLIKNNILDNTTITFNNN